MKPTAGAAVSSVRPVLTQYVKGQLSCAPCRLAPPAIGHLWGSSTRRSGKGIRRNRHQLARLRFEIKRDSSGTAGSDSCFVMGAGTSILDNRPWSAKGACLPRIVATIALLLASLLSGQARAAFCQGAVVTRINREGLALIAAELRALIPKTFTIPSMQAQVVDWPLTEDDAMAQIPDASAEVDVHSLRLDLASGGLRVSGLLSFSTASPVTVTNAYAGVGTAQCQARLQLSNASFDLVLRLLQRGPGVELEVLQVQLGLPPAGTNVTISSCALGNLLALVSALLGDHFAASAATVLENLAKEQLPSLASSVIGKTVSYQSERGPLRLSARVEGLRTDNTGLEVELGADVELANAPAGPPPCATVALTPPPCGEVRPQLIGGGGAMFSVALSEALLNRGLHAAWQSGRLCLDSSTLSDPAIRQRLLELGPTLGLSNATSLGFSVCFARPPSAQLNSATGIRLAISGMHVVMRLDGAAGSPQQAVIDADLAVSARPWIDPVANSIALDLYSATIHRFQVEGGAQHGLVFDEAKLERFVTAIVLPLAQRQLDQHQLSPSLIEAGRFLVALKHLAFGDRFIVAHLDAYRIEHTADRQGPDTLLVEGPGSPAIAPGMLRLLVSGIDNLTPPTLLRFAARVDGGAWSAPRYGSRVDVAVGQSSTVVQLAAVDGEGNWDPSPLQLPLVVDAIAPTITVTARPDQVLDHDAPSVAFRASDDRSSPAEIALRGLLFRIPDGGGEALELADQPLAPSAQTLGFSGLADGIYKIRIIATDRAGNTSSRDVGFLVEVGLGCQVGTRSAPPTLLWLLAFLAFLTRRQPTGRR